MWPRCGRRSRCTWWSCQKLGVYLITGVLALLAEALHTLSDIFVSGFLLVALFYARRYCTWWSPPT